MPTSVAEYQIVRRLDGGGMADVFVAHKMSPQGFVRRALIKRVKRSRPGYASLQSMLLDEARATACFDHPNIIGILDVGEDDQGIYMALEYVEGTDLRWVNSKLRTRKEALPFELACYITGEILRGLHHAHTVVGYDGRPLEIVHRDVNPANVLISYTGHVKLADFGVVRMRDRLQQKTEAGLVKGKYAYLAPEYIAGESCNYQTDIYAAGVMLFELLCGRECFTGSTAYEVMWKIVNRGVPLYRLEREGVPDDLSRIVQRAVNPVPERRFEAAEEMANALETWLMRNGKHATPWVLSVFFSRHGLFPAREEMPRAPVPEIAEIAEPFEEPLEPEDAAGEPFHVPGAVELPLAEPGDWIPPDDTNARPREPAKRLPLEEADTRFEGGRDAFAFSADAEAEAIARRDTLPPGAAEARQPRRLQEDEGSAPEMPASISEPKRTPSKPVLSKSAPEPAAAFARNEPRSEGSPSEEMSPEPTRAKLEAKAPPAREEKSASPLTIGIETPSGKFVVLDDIDLHSDLDAGEEPTSPSVPAVDLADLGLPEPAVIGAPEGRKITDEAATPPFGVEAVPETPARGVDVRIESPVEARGSLKPTRSNPKTARVPSAPEPPVSIESALGGPPIAAVPPAGREPATPVAPPAAAPVPTQVPISRTPSRIPVPAPPPRPMIVPSPADDLAMPRRSEPQAIKTPVPRELEELASSPTAVGPKPRPDAQTEDSSPSPWRDTGSPPAARAPTPPPSIEPSTASPIRLPKMPTPPGLSLRPTPVPAPAPSAAPPLAAPPPPPEPEPAAAASDEEPPGDVWRGKLEETSAAEVLDRLTQAGASGRLSFTCGLIWKQIQLDAGTPIGITSNMGMELIGEHLVKARLLSRRELDRALQAADREGQPLTAKLLELKLLDRDALEEELGKNLTARLSEVLEWRWGTFEFTQQQQEATTIRPKLDLAGLIAKALQARRNPGPEEDQAGAGGQAENTQSKLKDAFKRARAITQGSGKGRVDNLSGNGRSAKREDPPPKR